MTAGLASEAGAARTIYDAAREHFDAAPLRFWERYGARTVARLGLAPGARVLDLCTGTGSSAIAAARAVGPLGSVVGIDLSDPLLDLARAKAASHGLSNITLRQADMTTIDLPDGGFDAIVVVFGIFFAEDMEAQVRRLFAALRPGGTIAITTWGDRFFDPLYAPLLDSVRARLGSRDEYRPWDRLTTGAELGSLLRCAPFRDMRVEEEGGEEILDRPEDWWTIVLGTGLRGFVDRLDDVDREAVRTESISRAHGVRAVQTNVVYAIATK
jgi:SAM-dependent methyltransferase